MIKKLVAGTAIALGLAAGLAPTASADDFNWQWYDATFEFVDVLAPGGISSGSAYVPEATSIIVSPYGTSRLIECIGDGHYRVKECRQEGRPLIHAAQYPLRDVWFLG